MYVYDCIVFLPCFHPENRASGSAHGQVCLRIPVIISIVFSRALEESVNGYVQGVLWEQVVASVSSISVGIMVSSSRPCAAPTSRRSSRSAASSATSSTTALSSVPGFGSEFVTAFSPTVLPFFRFRLHLLRCHLSHGEISEARKQKVRRKPRERKSRSRLYNRARPRITFRKHGLCLRHLRLIRKHVV